MPGCRVVQLRNRSVIYHGNDLPGGKRALQGIAQDFRLPRGKWKAVIDDHETMILEHYRIIKQALECTYELAAPTPPDFGDDDYVDEG
ncbi:MAG TPA: hypothetical protein PKC18_00665 [Lacipirellulaceae bacterium]|nr:hypothetical protein [Lacipirellulaceae bacterium]HMP07269.1 hypothetical protein [Lacipirellulaceae bacterium]